MICSLLVSCLLFSSCTPPTGASESSFSSIFESSSSASSIINSTENEDISSPDNYNEEVPVEDIDFSDKTYLSYGDSITYGANPFKYYSQIENPYPKLVSDLLGFKTYYNPAISGATLCTNNKNLYCMTDVILSTTVQYDIVSVLLGFNDYNNNLPLGSIDDNNGSTIYGSLNLIAKHFELYYENSFIFFMTPYKSRTWDKVNNVGYNLGDVSQAVKNVAQKYDIPVLDMFNLGSFEVEMFNANSDGVHPSQDFFENYTAPQIAQFIKDNYK